MAHVNVENVLQQVGDVLLNYEANICTYQELTEMIDLYALDNLLLVAVVL